MRHETKSSDIRGNQTPSSCLSRTFAVGALIFVLTVLIAACSTNPEPASPTKAEFVPVTIENCGRSTTYASVPERAVTLNQHATEIMLALGLADKIVGTAYIDDEILPEYTSAYSGIPVIAEQYPSKEVFLNTEADFAYGGFRSAFTAEGVGTRDELEALSINSYLTKIFCVQDREDAPPIQEVYDDILNIGRIFGVQSKATSLVDTMKSDIASITSALEGVDDKSRVFVYDSGDDAPFTASCCGTAQLVVELAGGENIFGDVPGGWATVSWEEVIDKDPQVIILIDADWSTADEKQEFLLGNAALSSISAVQEKSFVRIPFSFTVPGVRINLAIKDLAAGFYPDRVN